MTSGRKLLLIGGGGHCRSVADSALRLGCYDKLGIIEKVSPGSSSSCSQIPVIGTDDDLPELFHAGWTDAFITVGSIGNTSLRRRLYRLVKNIGFSVPTIVDPSAVVSQSAVLQEGVFVGKRTVVNAGSEVGRCVILNTGSVIEHDCRIGDFSHVSPGAVLCGMVQVGHDSHIGAGSVVRQEITVGDHTVIGLGSVVVHSIPGDVTAYGNPCKVVCE